MVRRMPRFQRGSNLDFACGAASVSSPGSFQSVRINHPVVALHIGLAYSRVTPGSSGPPAHCWLQAAYECKRRRHQELIQGHRNPWKRSLV
jgi:hypothetical protein